MGKVFKNSSFNISCLQALLHHKSWFNWWISLIFDWKWYAASSFIDPYQTGRENTYSWCLSLTRKFIKQKPRAKLMNRWNYSWWYTTLSWWSWLILGFSCRLLLKRWKLWKSMRDIWRSSWKDFDSERFWFDLQRLYEIWGRNANCWSWRYWR